MRAANEPLFLFVYFLIFEGMAKHLSYDYIEASLNCDERRHAQEVLKDLGITYQHSTPQSVADQFWFWNCENIPDPLPKFLTAQDWDPMEMVGWGLSKEDAEKIRDYPGGN